MADRTDVGIYMFDIYRVIMENIYKVILLSGFIPFCISTLTKRV